MSAVEALCEAFATGPGSGRPRVLAGSGQLGYGVPDAAFEAGLARDPRLVGTDMHHGFPGRISTGGNLAFPFTPPELDAETAFRYSLNHVMETDELAEMFPVNC